jgi:epoxyqueuosine reductase
MLSAAETAWVVDKAKDLGFDLCGVATLRDAGPDSGDGWPELAHLDEWLAKGYAGEMGYLRNPQRSDPLRVMPEAQSVIVCALNYNTRHAYSTEAAAEAAASGEARGWISRYAWGDDYHEVAGQKLEDLVAALRRQFGSDFLARAYVDTGPIAERIAAQHAGLGWLAKNTCLINKELGSWLFLGVVVTSLALPASADSQNTPPADLCGNCRLCLDACPTEALVEPYVMDARRCISYLTIELRAKIPEDLRGAMGWQVFGCDICQDVCPWNRTAPVTTIAAFEPREKTFAPDLLWLLSLEEEEFRRIFRRSAVRRTKWRGLLRNACVAAGNSRAVLDDERRASLCARLEKLAASEDATIAEHARWAIVRLATPRE